MGIGGGVGVGVGVGAPPQLAVSNASVAIITDKILIFPLLADMT